MQKILFPVLYFDVNAHFTYFMAFHILIWTAGLAALERLEKSHYTYNGNNVVTTQANSFLIKSSSFLQNQGHE